MRNFTLILFSTFVACNFGNSQSDFSSISSMSCLDLKETRGLSIDKSEALSNFNYFLLNKGKLLALNLNDTIYLVNTNSNIVLHKLSIKSLEKKTNRLFKERIALFKDSLCLISLTNSSNTTKKENQIIIRIFDYNLNITTSLELKLDSSFIVKQDDFSSLYSIMLLENEKVVFDNFIFRDLVYENGKICPLSEGDIEVIIDQSTLKKVKIVPDGIGKYYLEKEQSIERHYFNDSNLAFKKLYDFPLGILINDSFIFCDNSRLGFRSHNYEKLSLLHFFKPDYSTLANYWHEGSIIFFRKQ